ncbi:MAG: ribonuclease Y [Candidatus Pacebacteria bacterium]|nr:ribonuclease Y [Candidatus Paceibacterota bacterium]
MTLIYLIVGGFIVFCLGSFLGYYARQSIAKKRKGTIEAKLQKKVEQTKQETEVLITQAKEKANQTIQEAQKEADERRKEVLATERLILKRERTLDEKLSAFDEKQNIFSDKVKKVRELKEKLVVLEEQANKKLEAVAGLSQEKAKEEIIKIAEGVYEKDIVERMHKLKQEGDEKFNNLAKEMISTAIQRNAQSQAQEITTTTVSLPSDEVKGRIIGKEGRNIKTFEKLTGVEVVVDDSPETVLISGFNPIRRQVAKVALEKLIKDGRIQPAKIEEQVKKAEEEIMAQVKEAGEKAVFETGILDLPPKIVELLGKLHFRTSYGQNVLMHSLEVSFLSAILAEELGVDVKVAKKAGLLHDIGKALDHQVQGSHVDIGIKVLEKFHIEKAVIDAMKSHHEEYEPESIEAVIVQSADQVSGARPGARKDTVENYLKRLKELEDIATGFVGVSEAYAIQAGREVRVFVKPEEVGDLEAYKIARDVATKIQEELNYPGEIKVTVIRETRVIEYAR